MCKFSVVSLNIDLTFLYFWEMLCVPLYDPFKRNLHGLLRQMCTLFYRCSLSLFYLWCHLTLILLCSFFVEMTFLVVKVSYWNPPLSLCWGLFSDFMSLSICFMKLDASCLCICLELLCSFHEWISSLFTVRLELLKILLTSFGLKSILSAIKQWHLLIS